MKVSIFTALISVISANAASIDTECKGKQILKQTYIGANKDVSAEYYSCASSFASRAVGPFRERRQTNNQCGKPCTTYCYTPSGGGPDPNECQVVADALLYESQNTGLQFTIGASGPTSVNFIRLTYSSCNTTFVNQDTITMTYCRKDWAGVTGYVAKNCQATQNAHGGICVANDQKFFIQINHS